MAYEPKQIALTGSMNLLPAADSLPDGDHSILQNWRVDQVGQLASVRGCDLQATLANSIHSLFRFGDYRYGGAGTGLYYDATLSTLVASGFSGDPLQFAASRGQLFVMNPSKRARVVAATAYNWGIEAPATAPTVTVGAAITTTVAQFDQSEGWNVYYISGATPETGNPEVEVLVTDAGSVAATYGSSTLFGTGTDWQPSIAGKRIRITGAVDTVTLTVSAWVSADQLTLSGVYTDVTASALAYQILEVTQVRQWETVNKQSGTHSLHVEANPAGRYQARRDGFSPVDARLEGAALDADVFKMWVYCSNPADVSAMSVELYSGLTSPKPYAVAFVDPSNLVQTPFSWTQLSILRGINGEAIIANNAELAQVQADLRAAEERGDTATAATLRATLERLYDAAVATTPYFRRDANFDWAQVTSMVVDFTVTQPTDVYFDLAQFSGGQAGSINGTVSYAVTFANDEEDESDLSPYSAETLVEKKRVTLTIPVSPDPQVTRRYVYRIGAGLNAPLRILEVSGNSTTTVTDTVTNADAQIDNIEPPDSADLPPAARGLAGPADQGRLYAFSTVEHPNRYWWTPVAEPHRFRGSSDDQEGDWQDCGDDGEAILKITFHGGTKVMYKQQSVWLLHGDPDDNDPVKSSSKVAIYGRQAACSAGPYDYVAASDGSEGPGIYAFDGSTERKISAKVDPIFRGDYVDLGNVTIAPMSRVYASACLIEFCNGQVWFSYPEEGQTTPNVTLVYNTFTGNWSMRKLGFGTGGFTALYNEGQGLGLAFLGGAGVKLVNLESNRADAGSAIPLVWQSGYFDAGAPDTLKRFGVVRFQYRTAEGSESPAALTASLLLDDGATTVALGTLQSAGWARAQIPVDGVDGRRGFNAALRVAGSTSSTVRLRDVYLDYYAEGKQMAVYDSGVIAMAGGMPGEVEQIEIEATATSPITYSLSTDLPGGTVTQRETAAVTFTTGRQTKVVEFARDSRPIGRTGRLALAGSSFELHRVRLKIRPVPVFLEPGDNYELELELGQPHMFREIEFDCDASGTATGAIALELPGQNIAQRQAVSILTDATTTGRRPFNQRLASNLSGQIVRVTLSGTVRLWGIRLYARRLGVAAQWGWVSMPVPQCPENFSYVELPVETA